MLDWLVSFLLACLVTAMFVFLAYNVLPIILYIFG